MQSGNSGANILALPKKEEEYSWGPPAHPTAVHSPSPKSFRKSKFEDGAARLVAVL